MKSRFPSTTLLPVLLFAWLAGCGEEKGSSKEYPVSLAEGTYRVAFVLTRAPPVREAANPPDLLRCSA